MSPPRIHCGGEVFDVFFGQQLRQLGLDCLHRVIGLDIDPGLIAELLLRAASWKDEEGFPARVLGRVAALRADATGPWPLEGLQMLAEEPVRLVIVPMQTVQLFVGHNPRGCEHGDPRLP